MYILTQADKRRLRRAPHFQYHRAMALGEQIQAWRISRGRSVVDLASELSLLPHVLEEIEAGETDLSLSRLEALAAALKIPPAWLFSHPTSFRTLFDDPEEDTGSSPAGTKVAHALRISAVVDALDRDRNAGHRNGKVGEFETELAELQIALDAHDHRFRPGVPIGVAARHGNHVGVVVEQRTTTMLLNYITRYSTKCYIIKMYIEKIGTL